MSLTLSLMVLMGLSALAFWQINSRMIVPVFMIMAAVSIMLGLYWYDIYTNEIGMTISLALIGYSFLSIGFAFWLTLGVSEDE